MSLVQLPILARELTAEEFAWVIGAQAGASLFVLFASESSTLAFQRFPGSETNRSHYREARRLLLRNSLVLLAVNLSIGWALGSPMVFLAVCGWGLGLSVVRLTSASWLMWRRPWRYATSQIPVVLVRIAGLLALITAGLDPLASVAVAGILAAAVGAFISPRAAMAKRAKMRSWAGDVGTSLAVASLGYTLLQGTDKILAPVVLAKEEAGSYAALSSLAALALGSLHGLISSSVYPDLIAHWGRGEVDLARLALNRSIAAIQLTTSVGLVVVLVSGGPLLAHFYGNEWADTRILITLLVGVGLMSLGHQYSWVYHLSLRTTEMRNRSLSIGVVTVPLVAGLGTTFGGRGIALAFLLATGLYALVLGTHLSGTLARAGAIALLVIAGAMSLVPATWGAGAAVVVSVGATVLLRRQFVAQAEEMRRVFEEVKI